MNLKTLLILISIFFSQYSFAGLINLSDDAFTEESLAFDFEFFGETYSSVFVGSNGYLTFGTGDSDFSESIAELLSDQARIAVWDDFHPGNGGTIETTSTSSYFSVSFDLVPEFSNVGANSFDITIFENGGIEIFFESLTSNDMLVGISAGGGTSGTAVDFSTSSRWTNTETIYQQFDSNFDLGGKTLSFGVTEVPEPSPLLLFSLGFAGFIFYRRRQA